MNRYIYHDIQEVWRSYEWLLKTKLEEIDHMTRQMYREMQIARGSIADIEEFLPAAFAALWERVAAEQEAQRAGSVGRCKKNGE